MIKELISYRFPLFFLMACIVSPSWGTDKNPPSRHTLKASIMTTGLLALSPQNILTKSTTVVRQSKGKTYTFYTDSTVAVTGPFGEDLGTYKTNNPYPKRYQTISLEKEGRQRGVFVGLGLQGGCSECGDNQCTDPANCIHGNENKEAEQEDNNENNNATDFAKNLEKGLKDALPHIKRARGKNCVILIGDTGVGKSTLINALYSGIENIEEVEQTLNDDYGESIEIVLAPKQAIKDEQGNILFRVGSGNQSVTSYPEIAEQRGIAFCDCPGFGDTRGGMFDIVHCISMGELFIKARSVQICYLMTESDIMNPSGRGNTIKKLLETVSSIFKDNQQGGRQFITYDNLKKLRFIITNLSGNTKKVNLIRNFGRILNEKISNIDDNRILADLLRKNVFLIDAKDRPNKFAEGETGDKVAYLKQKLVALDRNMLYHPNVLKDPITCKAKEKINAFLKSMEDRANAIAHSNDYGRHASENTIGTDAVTRKLAYGVSMLFSNTTEEIYKNRLGGMVEQIEEGVLPHLVILSKYRVLKPFVNPCIRYVNKIKDSAASREKQKTSEEDFRDLVKGAVAVGMLTGL